VPAAAKAATPATAAGPPTASAASSYRRIAPSFRILDTRSGLCGGSVCHALGAKATQRLQITGYVDPGTGQSVPTGATAVALNVTAVGGTSFSLLTVYPTGESPVPTASNLNFPAHTALANSVVAQIGTGGAVNIFNALGTVDVLADVEGYFVPAASSAPAGEYHPIVPIRVCDTRSGDGITATTCNGLNNGQPHTLGPNSAIKVEIAGPPAYCSSSPCLPNDFIPTDGTEENAIVNLTGLAGSVNTFLSIVPFTTTGCEFGGKKGMPTSDVNVNAGGVQANRVFVPLGTGATPLNVCVYNAAGKANFIIDADGWFGGTGPPVTPTGLQYIATAPTRVCDTRIGNATPCSGHPLGKGGVLPVTVDGVDGISSSAQAVIANLTAVSGSAFTFLSAYPSGGSRPNVSDVNVSAGQVLPNLTAITLGGSPGSFDLYNAVGTINAVVDVEGWFQ
jgi:hypothetical protein